MADPLEARICNWILELLAHTFGCLCALPAAGAVPAGALELDMFLMCLYNNGVIDDQGYSAPLSKDARDNMFTTTCLTSSSGIGGCFGKILNDNWEMTY